MNTYFKQSLLASAVTLALVACGGGSDSGTPVVTALTLSGTAATGAAIANAPVNAKCGTGTGTATTAANGSFTIAITGGALPCVIEVRPTVGGALRSVADGSGSGSVSINITPLTELVAARMAGGSPADLFTNFDAAAQAKVTPAAVSAAIAAIVSALQGVVDLTGVNPMRDALVAASGSTAGNPLDQKLDALQAALAAAQTSLAEVVTAVGSSGSSTAPVATILHPAAASCAGFRSGKYRVINPHEVGHDAAYVSHLITVDAAALKGSNDLDATHAQFAITPVTGSACKFTVPGDFGTSTVLVSRSGIAVVLSASSTGQTRTSIVVPEQSLPLSELAGTWNHFDYDRASTTSAYAPSAGVATIDATGAITASSQCTGLNTCTVNAPPFESFTVNPSGGFNIGTGTAAARAFAFKTGTGKVSMFIIDPATAAITVATKQAGLSLPAVGDVAKFYDFSIGSNGVAGALSDATTTVKTIDAVTASFTRERASDGRIDGFTLDKPRAGVRYRAAGTSPVTGGGSLSYAEILVLPLPDTGITVNTSVATTQNFFGVSINHP